jgi:Secreted repeat of unknown function
LAIKVIGVTAERAVDDGAVLVGPAGVTATGIDSAVLGTVDRADRTMQVTIGGWPVYRCGQDMRPGDINGQRVSGIWFAVTPTGEKANANGAGGATLSRAKSDQLSDIVIDADGFTCTASTRTGRGRRADAAVADRGHRRGDHSREAHRRRHRRRDPDARRRAVH